MVLGWLGLATMPPACALDRDDIGFYLSFEQGLRPDIAAGETRIQCSSGTPEAVPFDQAGLRGRAVKLDDTLNL